MYIQYKIHICRLCTYSIDKWYIWMDGWILLYSSIYILRQMVCITPVIESAMLVLANGESTHGIYNTE